MNYALILAGGSGTRTELDIPKQYYEVNEKPVLIYTLEKFQYCSMIDGIYVVCAPEWIEAVEKMCKEFRIAKLIRTVKGGSTGLKSALNGLADMREVKAQDLVLIHDAVRPFVDAESIEENIRTALKYGMAVTTVNCQETLVYVQDEPISDTLVPRDGLKRVLTPQTFRFGEIYSLLSNEDLDHCTEPSAFALWMKKGNRVYCSEGNERNIKLTYKDDIEYFKKMFE